mmetsp:Transcript_37429/g.79397  ORF Transcript_37429/g.79397 Transcript_37429/m.79397 type:complete len:269 (-) Transcript_37429:65-871(-)
MGWDDSDESGDDWENDDIEKKLEEHKKEVERQRRRDEGLSSESEKEEEAPKATAPKAATKAKPKAKAAAVKEEEEQLTAEERKLRQRQMEEEQDARMASDLLGGLELADEAKEAKAAKEAAAAKKKAAAAASSSASKSGIQVIDQWESFTAHKSADIDGLAAKVGKKVNDGKFKAGSSTMCLTLLKALADQMTKEDLQSIEKLLTQMSREKASSKADTLSKENKANNAGRNKKYDVHEELDEGYGDMDEYTPEEWAAWEAQQRKSGGW